MMKQLKYGVILLSVFSIAFFSCKKKEYAPPYLGYDYFPNNVGHYVIYECDSIVVNPFKSSTPPFDTFKYQIKEVIDSIYNNNQGQPTQRIVRYKRADSVTNTLPWSSILVPQKVWTGTLLSNMATRLEDNNNYVKLVFPISANEIWNGNAINSMPTWNYQYTALNTPATINGHTFDSTLTVMQQSYSSFFQYQYYYEQYATGIGLIYKEVIDYSDTSFISNPPPSSIATSGTVFYSETYLSSGNQ